MKTILLVVSFFFAVSISFAGNTEGNPVLTPVSSVNASNSSINKAIGAIKSACPNSQGKLSFNQTVVASCFVDGFITKVTFWTTPNCPGNQVCIQTAIIVGSVLLDCDGNVMSVTCGVSEI